MNPKSPIVIALDNLDAMAAQWASTIRQMRAAWPTVEQTPAARALWRDLAGRQRLAVHQVDQELSQLEAELAEPE